MFSQKTIIGKRKKVFMKVNKLSLLLIIFLLIGTISAQKTWEKPFEKWSREDAIKILNTSPWVQTYQSTEALAAIGSQNSSQTNADMKITSTGAVSSKYQVAGRVNLAVPAVFIRLHSALPVRQALVRLQQIEAGYDKNG